jgi:hypothetical protein
MWGMSRMFVPKDTIDALVTAAFTWGYTTPGEFWFRPMASRSMTTVTWDDATAIGHMLWRHNYDITEGWVQPLQIEWPGYEFERYPGEPDPVVVLKAIHFSRSETAADPEEFEVGPIAGFLTYLELVAITHLPGYGDAPRGIWDRHAFGA